MAKRAARKPGTSTKRPRSESLYDDIESAWLVERPDLDLQNQGRFHSENITTPYLTIHDDQDGAVPQCEGIEFITAMRRLHKPAYMFVFNGKDHNLRDTTADREELKFWAVHFDEWFDYWLMGAPRPPYSLGQCTAIHPAACIFLCHATRRVHSSPASLCMNSSAKRLRRSLSGRFASSHDRSSWRNASSAALSLKSTALPFPASRFRAQPLGRPRTRSPMMLC